MKYAALIVPLALHAQTAVRPGKFTVEPPTLICLGFDWDIAGDDNRNASVDVQYRRAGASQWNTALPLLRIGGERVFRLAEHLDYTTPHKFAGSILDLEPATEYEVRLTMRDPDGVQGQAVQTAKVRTRAEPKEAAGGRVLHVYPPLWRGPKQERAFTGLKAAYYGPGTGDWSAVWERRVQPGDVILVHAGLYKAERLNYVDPLSAPFDGAYVLTSKGTPEKPIVIRAAGDGEVVFDGDGAFRLFDVMGSAWHIFEGLTIKNTDVAFWAGLKGVAGAVGLTVRNCRMENVGIGVTTQFAGSKDFYIADNIFIGREDPHRVHGWSNPGIYGAHALRSYYAVKVYGSGHVIAHNAAAYFHDGISVCTHGSPTPGEEAVAIDIYNNDIHVTGDDFIEADGGVHNIRVMRNRGVNAAHTALSAQPVFGGPAYFIRNIVYHAPTALKFMAKPAGLLVYHNTLISENANTQTFSNAHFRNNLILGTDRPGRAISVFPNATSYSSWDHNGYRPNRGGGDQYVWIAPAPGILRDYEIAAQAARRFASLADLARATGQETHGVEIDYDVLENLEGPAPDDPRKVYHAVDLDFRLKAGGKAVDAGLTLPNVNDGFAGRAPDLGALEAGQIPPVYGPRGRSARQPFYR